jgi:hypothetical protein
MMGTAVIAVAVSVLPCAAQAPVAAPAPTPTIWNRLGIPSQPLSGIVNRGGNFPGLERKPRLKGIADPANLASDNAAIKKAAEIKAQEDMAQQKIKAIKYLAEIGCGGCYKGVDKALAEALGDCTEAVRYEAVKAIIAASDCGANECVRKCVKETKTCKENMCDCWVGCMKRTCQTMHLLCGKPLPDGTTLKSMCPGYGCGAGGNCPGSRCACGDGNCCTSEILNKLSTMAFEKDDRGCWKEPSARVRAMARQALRACGPNIRPMTDADIPVPEEVPLQVEPVKPAPGETVPQKPRETVPQKTPETVPLQVPETAPKAAPEKAPANPGDKPAAADDKDSSAAIDEGGEAAIQLTEEAAPAAEETAVTADEAPSAEPAIAPEAPATLADEPAEPAADVAMSPVSSDMSVLVSLEVPMAPDPDDVFQQPAAVQPPAKAHAQPVKPATAESKGIFSWFRRR